MRLPSAPHVDPVHHQTLLDVAQEAIRSALSTGRQRLPDPAGFHPDLLVDTATFVTLEDGSRLLGCIGTLEPVRPLVVDVAYEALGAAFADPRMAAVTAEDFVRMSIKVSVLSRMEPLPANSHADVAHAVRPGVDGLLLEAPGHRSTLLPSVWPKVVDVSEFLSVLWRKAGMRPGDWPAGTRVSRYVTEEFGHPGPRAFQT